MKIGHLWKSLTILGAVVIAISFIPSSIFQATDDLSSDYYRGHLIQCPENPFLSVSEWNRKPIALRILTISESTDLIKGKPIENISTVFSLINVSEWSGIVNLQAPGLYVILVTAINPSEELLCSISVLRVLPQYGLLCAGLTILGLGFVFYLPKSTKVLRVLLKGKGRSLMRKESSIQLQKNTETRLRRDDSNC